MRPVQATVAHIGLVASQERTSQTMENGPAGDSKNGGIFGGPDTTQVALRVSRRGRTRFVLVRLLKQLRVNSGANTTGIDQPQADLIIVKLNFVSYYQS